MQSAAKEPILQVNTSRGKPIATRYGQVIPVTRAMKVRWPGGGLTWNRPAAIEVQQGQTWRRVPIKDTTSRIIFSITLVELTIAFGMSSFLKRRRRHKHD
ncbi:MAG TPA: hypothetical protein VKR83_12590 [Ktedonobacteraceae bacterium]|nr:hypothetical protein [Ktedonobacteraceae bacterium]